MKSPSNAASFCKQTAVYDRAMLFKLIKTLTYKIYRYAKILYLAMNFIHSDE